MPLEQLCIILVGLAVAVTCGYSMFLAPRRLKRGQKPKEILELEVEARMAAGMEKIDALRRLAAGYLKHRDTYAAEMTLKEAISLAGSILGQRHPQLKELLLDQERLLRAGGRNGEAEAVRRRISELAE